MVTSVLRVCSLQILLLTLVGLAPGEHQLLFHGITSTARTLFSDSAKELVHEALSFTDMVRIVQHCNFALKDCSLQDFASCTGEAGMPGTTSDY